MTRRRRLVLFALAIIAPAAVLSVLSWNSLREEKAERRRTLVREANDALSLAITGAENRLEAAARQWWSSVTDPVARAREGRNVMAVRSADGAWLYPLRYDSAAAPLEVMLEREDPDLVAPYRAARDREFIDGNPDDAATTYAEIQSEVETPGLQAALLHARARALGQVEAYERLATEFGDLRGESGLPYEVIARIRLAELEPGKTRLRDLTATLSNRGVSGHVRARIFEDLDRAEFVRSRMLEKLEDGLVLEKTKADRLVGAHLLTFRTMGSLSTAAALPFPLPDPVRKDGIEIRFAGFQGERLAGKRSDRFEGLEATAALMDAARLETPAAKLWVTGGLVLLLLASLLFGVIAILRAVDQEMRLAQAKAEFVTGVSHDFKTPLTSIRMFAEMLEDRKVKGEKKTREYYRRIHQESIRLSRMVDNVLDVSRIEEGRKVYARSTLDLGAVVRSAAGTFEAQCSGNGLTFETDIPKEPLRARLDEDAVTGAILNLLDNAAKYAGENSRIRLSVESLGERAVVRVQDDGPGIPAEDREKLFEKFYRGSAARSGPAGGAGLGLAIVRHVMDGHEGAVTLESAPGRGSRFALSFPTCPESSS